MRNYYKTNTEQNEKKKQRSKEWWSVPENRYKYHPLKTTPRPAAWNKGLTIKDGRVARNAERVSKARRARKTLTDAERAHLVTMTRRGPENNMWKGGITPEKHKLLTSPEGRLWAKTVIERFHSTCFTCGGKDDLLAHHLFPREFYPEIAHHLDNGVALCRSCHMKLHGRSPNDETKKDSWKRRVLVPDTLDFPTSLEIYLLN